MNLELRMYFVTILIEMSSIKCNNHKVNSLQRCVIAMNYIILHRVVQRLPQHNLKISHHRHIQKLRQRKKWFI
jgi:hypothetical protein